MGLGSLLAKILGEGIKTLLPALLPKLQPLLEQALKDLLFKVFENVGTKNPTAGGVLGMTNGVPSAEVQKAVEEEVSKFMIS